MQILSDGRFTLGLGSGENLNEHIVGKGWPTVERRQDMLREAIKIIRELFGGELVNWRGDYFQVDSARLWDVPDVPAGIAVAIGGKEAIDRFVKLADHFVAVEPDRELVDAWHAARQVANGAHAGRVVGQIPVSWDPDRDAAIERAHDQFRWFAGGWKVNADLPTPAGFAGATQFVRPEDVAESIPCGPDLDAIVDAIRPYWEAGFTDVALVQIGGDTQERFLKEAAEPLLDALRDASRLGADHPGVPERKGHRGIVSAGQWVCRWAQRCCWWRRSASIACCSGGTVCRCWCRLPTDAPTPDSHCSARP